LYLFYWLLLLLLTLSWSGDNLNVVADRTLLAKGEDILDIAFFKLGAMGTG